MTFFLTNSANLTLKPTIKGPMGQPVVTAAFRLFVLNADGSQASEIAVNADKSFTVSAPQGGGNLALELQVQPVFGTATSADVYVDANQGPTAIADAHAPNGKPDDWFLTVTAQGQIRSTNLSVSFPNA